MRLENAAYYASLAPSAFRIPEQEGLVKDSEPGADANTDSALTLVAEVDGRFAGYLEAQLLPPLETARYQSQPDLAHPRLFINALGTLQEYWRRGVATQLVDAAEAWGRERGAVVSICDTYVASPVSIPFWEERMGYERRAVILRKPLA
jgi:GNAT superfamily N-acetyltransferase